MIKSHVLYRLSYGLYASMRALNGKAGATSRVWLEEAPARDAGRPIKGSA
jgi:hypothetical protein